MTKAREYNLKPETFFNCCTDHREPQWSRFAGLEIGGCIDDGGNTHGGKSFYEAQFYTVYGRKPDGECEAITDIPASAAHGGTVLHLGLATLIGAQLGARAGLPVTLYRLA